MNKEDKGIFHGTKESINLNNLGKTTSGTVLNSCANQPKLCAVYMKIKYPELYSGDHDHKNTRSKRGVNRTTKISYTNIISV